MKTLELYFQGRVDTVAVEQMTKFMFYLCPRDLSHLGSCSLTIIESLGTRHQAKHFKKPPYVIFTSMGEGDNMKEKYYEVGTVFILIY